MWEEETMITSLSLQLIKPQLSLDSCTETEVTWLITHYVFTVLYSYSETPHHENYLGVLLFMAV